MFSFTHRIAVSAPVARSIAVAALLGATFLTSPVIAAPNDNADATAPTSQQQPAVKAANARAETVEQRITSLHKALKITADEESKWGDVAQAMRENAAAMEKLVAEKSGKTAQEVSAVDDLKTYEQFTQAHVEGLKNLISSFETLYDSMPDPQKKVADKVFQGFGRKNAHA
jgi:hypothetical protein